MKLEIGAGNAKTPGFIHTDRLITFPKGEHHIEIVCRGEELPFRNNQFENIFMWGVFEHFAKWDALRLLAECNRVLIRGGLVEFTTPDVIAACKIMIEGKLPFSDNFIEWKSNWSRKENIDFYALSCLYGGESDQMLHKYGWSKESLDCKLNDAGFDIITFDSRAYQPNTHLHYIVRKR